MKSSQHRTWANTYTGWAVVAFVTLALYVLTRAREPFWDEVPYLDRARALVTSTSFRGWVLDSDAVAAGPSHALLNYGLSNGAGVLPVPWVRFPNLVLLVGMIAGLAWCTRRSGSEPRTALSVLAVPMLWVVCGLAISEPLGLAGITLAMGGAILWRTRGDSRFAGVAGLAALAVGAALATTTRQNYAVAMPGLLLMASSARRDWLAPACALVVGLVPLSGLAMLWHGLVPPEQAHVATGLSVENGFLALAITGVVTVILAPGWYLACGRAAVAVGVCAAVVNEVAGVVRPTTLTSVQRLLGHPEAARIVERLAGDFFIGCGAAFFAAAFVNLRRCRDTVVAGAMIAVLCMCGAAAAVTHQFSSRYPVMALPFLVVALAPAMTFGPWALGRAVFGSVLGLLSLHSYYVFAR